MEAESVKPNHVVALITCADWPTMSPEGQILLAELRKLGIDAQPRIWDDPSVDWSLADVCVIRETWDYHHRRNEFVAWAERVASQTVLLNAAEVVRWNTHKGYLRDLEARGVTIVPTVWLETGTTGDFAQIMSTNGWEQAVIKPAISASAFETILVSHNQIVEGQAHIDRLLHSRDLMVQLYIPSVRDYGERSIVFIAGELSHAARRAAALHLDEGETIWNSALVEPTAEEAAFAQNALYASGYPTLYARVDIVHDQSDQIRLMELELVEPSLFLTLAPHAATRLARAINVPYSQ